MTNIFSDAEDEILSDETIIFDKEKIKRKLSNIISERLSLLDNAKKPFFFQDIVYDFFDYMRINLIKTGKTRDAGLDGVIKLQTELLGEINLGLQIKYKLLDSNDVDLFIASLRNAELQVGLIVCKDSRKLEKYDLNSKIKTILFSKGIKIREKLIKEDVSINPVFVLKFDDILDVAASNLRGFVMGVYKK